MRLCLERHPITRLGSLRAVEGVAFSLLLSQKGKTQDLAYGPKEGPAGVKRKTLRGWGTALGLRNETPVPDSSAAPAENNSVPFPKFLVNSVRDTLGSCMCHRGWANAEPCPLFSTRHLKNGYKRIPPKQKELLADNTAVPPLSLNQGRVII